MGSDVVVDAAVLRMAANEVTAKVNAYAETRSSVGWRPVDSCGSRAVSDTVDLLESWYQAQWARAREGVNGLANGAREAANAYEETDGAVAGSFVQVFGG